MSQAVQPGEGRGQRDLRGQRAGLRVLGGPGAGHPGHARAHSRPGRPAAARGLRRHDVRVAAVGPGRRPARRRPHGRRRRAGGVGRTAGDGGRAGRGGGPGRRARHVLLRRRHQHLGRRDERRGRRRRAPAGPHDHAALPRRLQPRHRARRAGRRRLRQAGVSLEWQLAVTVVAILLVGLARSRTFLPPAGRPSGGQRTVLGAGRLAGAADAADRRCWCWRSRSARGSPTTGWRSRWWTATTPRRPSARSASARSSPR